MLSISPVYPSISALRNTSPGSALYCLFPAPHTQSTNFSLPSDAVIPLSRLMICAAVQRLGEHSACVNDAGNWHSDYCVDMGCSIMTNLKLHNLTTPDQAVVLFTAFCYLFLLSLWKPFFPLFITEVFLILQLNLSIKCIMYVYTECFTTCEHYCTRWFPRSLWSKKFI